MSADIFPSNLTLLVLCVGCTSFIYIYLYYYRSKTSGKLPPGPAPFPIVGNHYQIPQVKPWETFDQWKQKYGDVIHITHFGKHLIILNSLKAVMDLFEQRSVIYSSRPQTIMGCELMTFGIATGFLPYNAAWRKHRAIYNQQVNMGVIRQFQGLQTRAIAGLLQALIKNPENFDKHIRHMVGTVVLGFAYDYKVMPENDDYVNLTEKSNYFFARVTKPGEFVVDSLPWLKHIPSWIPGAGFQKVAQEGRETMVRLREVLFQRVKAQMAAGTARASFVATSLSDLGTDDESNPEVEAVKLVAAGFFSAGTHTTTATIQSFVLAMALYPEVAKKAQNELDRVIGPNRLPNFNDRHSLPYIDAVVKEVFRWFPISPLGVPHATMEEDIYNGYRIPRGSTVFANIWSILRDPDMYPDPLVFRPERFIKEQSGKCQPDPTLMGSFGYGRRICPGKNLADSTVWFAIASLLAVFNIGSPVDKYGNTIDVSYALEPQGTGLNRPQPFPCRFTPRLKETFEFIKSLEI